jgi:hypothetical protein
MRLLQISSIAKQPGRRAEPVKAAGAAEAKNASTAPWKTSRPGFPQLPPALLLTLINWHSTDLDQLAFRP